MPPTVTPLTMAATAPNDAPEEAPSRNGSANGFRTTACRTAPTSANPAPTNTASSARGIRYCQTIRWTTGSPLSAGNQGST